MGATVPFDTYARGSALCARLCSILPPPLSGYRDFESKGSPRFKHPHSKETTSNHPDAMAKQVVHNKMTQAVISSI